MNLLYLKYAVEVAAVGSVNRAAERLYIDQANLSRCIKDLESSLGVSIFERSPRGMKVTPDGEIFLNYARTILRQVDAMEHLFLKGNAHKQHFSVSVPRASYISAAFSAFSARISEAESAEIYYKETNAMRTIRNILEADYKLGIVRYAESYDRYYKDMFEEKGLISELIAEFHYVLLMHADSPLAGKEQLTFADLHDLTEIAHADPYVPSLPLTEIRKEELPSVSRRICVFERGSQFDLLCANPRTFMWVSPVPPDLLARYGLVQRVCGENRRIYKDMMIYRKDYRLTELDRAFISELCRVRREIFVPQVQ